MNVHHDSGIPWDPELFVCQFVCLVLLMADSLGFLDGDTLSDTLALSRPLSFAITCNKYAAYTHSICSMSDERGGKWAKVGDRDDVGTTWLRRGHVD